jgi:hypothetical protein
MSRHVKQMRVKAQSQRCELNNLRLSHPHGSEIFLLQKILILNGYIGRGLALTLSSSAVVKDEWSCTSTPPYVLIVREGPLHHRICSVYADKRYLANQQIPRIFTEPKASFSCLQSAACLAPFSSTPPIHVHVFQAVSFLQVSVPKRSGLNPRNLKLYDPSKRRKALIIDKSSNLA